MAYALFIDDDPSITHSVLELAKSRELELETASTWQEGMDKFRALSPDLVISDYHLPGSDMGLKLLMKIASLRPSVRVVLISAYLSQGDAEKVKNLGLVHEVVIKTNPMAAARKIVSEIEQAKVRASQPTDWLSFSQASSGIWDYDEKAFDELDNYLRSQRLPDSGGKRHE